MSLQSLCEFCRPNWGQNAIVLAANKDTPAMA